jgi:diamine N-acetyltransferase
MIEITEVKSCEQIAEVAQLARAIWTAHYVPIVGRRQVEYMLERFQSAEAIATQLAGSFEYYILADAGRSVGYLALLPDAGEQSVMISKIYVRESDRGRGFGARLLAFAESVCRQRGLKLLWLTVNRHNTASIDWYLRMGFVNAGTIVQDIGAGFVMDDYRMEKAVRDASQIRCEFSTTDRA